MSTPGVRDRVHFARIFGTAQDIDLQRRQDYVYIKHTNTSSTAHKFEFKVWKNIGSGSTKLKGMCKWLWYRRDQIRCTNPFVCV